jgi:hypothetical protein
MADKRHTMSSRLFCMKHISKVRFYLLLNCVRTASRERALGGY